MNSEIETIKKELERICGNWNGEDEGREENNFMIASEALEQIEELENTIDNILE